MKATELLIHKKNTRAFIAADPFSVALKRPGFASDGIGGRTSTDATLTAQTVRIIPARTRSSNLSHALPSGIVLSSKDYMLIAMPDADVKVKDYFTYMNASFQIGYVSDQREIMTICQLDRLGRTARST